MRRAVQQPAPLVTVPVNDAEGRLTAILERTSGRLDR
jgi:hypothetical protein